MSIKNYHLSDEDLNAYLDAELEQAAVEKVEQHIAGCEVCSARLENLGDLFTQIEGLPEVSYQGDLVDSVLTEIEGSAVTEGRWPWWIMLQLGLAGLLLLLIAPLSRLGSGGWSALVQAITLPASWLLEELYGFMVTISDTLYAIPLGVGRLLDVDGFGVVAYTNNLMIVAAILVGLLLWVTGNTLLLGRNGTRD